MGGNKLPDLPLLLRQKHAVGRGGFSHGLLLRIIEFTTRDQVDRVNDLSNMCRCSYRC